jgi:hypothetical protein
MQREHGRIHGSVLCVLGAREGAGARDASHRGTGADRGTAKGAGRATRLLARGCNTPGVTVTKT